MAKSKRNRVRSTHLSPAALERARQQAKEAADAATEPVEEDETPDDEATEVMEPVEPTPKSNRAVERAARRKQRRENRGQYATPGVIQYSQHRPKDKEKLTAAETATILAHPTKFVSETELREQYHYVARDLVNMGKLAAGLVVFLVLLAQFI